MANKVKRPFIITIEAIAPVRLEYRVLADSEEAAYDDYNKHSARMPQYRPPVIDTLRLKKLKISIKDLFTGQVNLKKTF